MAPRVMVVSPVRLRRLVRIHEVWGRGIQYGPETDQQLVAHLDAGGWGIQCDLEIGHEVVSVDRL